MAVLELLVEKKKGTTKPKGVHIIGSQEDDAVPEDQDTERVYAVDSRPTSSEKWFSHDFRFPCPIESNTHKLFQ